MFSVQSFSAGSDVPVSSLSVSRPTIPVPVLFPALPVQPAWFARMKEAISQLPQLRLRVIGVGLTRSSYKWSKCGELCLVLVDDVETPVLSNSNSDSDSDSKPAVVTFKQSEAASISSPQSDSSSHGVDTAPPTDSGLSAFYTAVKQIQDTFEAEDLGGFDCSLLHAPRLEGGSTCLFLTIGRIEGSNEPCNSSKRQAADLSIRNAVDSINAKLNKQPESVFFAKFDLQPFNEQPKTVPTAESTPSKPNLKFSDDTYELQPDVSHAHPTIQLLMKAHLCASTHYSTNHATLDPRQRGANIVLDRVNSWPTLCDLSNRIMTELEGVNVDFKSWTEDARKIVGQIQVNSFPSLHYFTRPERTSLTLREIEMHIFQNAVREKVDWHLKIENSSVRSLWRERWLAQSTLQSPMSADAAITELRWWGKQMRDCAPSAGLSPSSIVLPSVPGAWMCNNLLEPSLFIELQTALESLERVTPSDFQPNSHNQASNLIDPSLYCLHNSSFRKYGVFSGSNNSAPGQFSREFAWIPTDFSVSNDGKSVHLQSYVNNLHPNRPESAILTPLLERTLAQLLPLFERTLSELHSPQTARCQTQAARRKALRAGEDASLQDQDATRLDRWNEYRADEETTAVPLTLAVINEDDSISLPPIPTVIPREAPKPEKPKLQLEPRDESLAATFVRDLSLFDGSTVECDTIVTKKWLIRNTGTRRWEANELTLVRTDRLRGGQTSTFSQLLPLDAIQNVAKDAMRIPSVTCESHQAAEPGEEVILTFRAWVRFCPGRHQLRLWLVPRTLTTAVQDWEEMFRQAANYAILRLWVDVQCERRGDSPDLFDSLDFRPKVGDDPPGPSSEEEVKTFDSLDARYAIPAQSEFFPLDDRQSENTRHLLNVLSKTQDISPAALGFLTEFQDRLALGILQQHLCLAKEPLRRRNCDWWEGISKLEESPPDWKARHGFGSTLQKQIAEGGSDTMLHWAAGESTLCMRLRWFVIPHMMELNKHANSQMLANATKWQDQQTRENAPVERLPKGNSFSCYELADKWIQQFSKLRPEISVELTPENRIRLLVCIEYFTAELLELGSKIARESGRKMIQLAHIVLAILKDEELPYLAEYLRINLAADQSLCFMNRGSPNDLLYDERIEKWMKARTQDEISGYMGIAKGIDIPEAAFPFEPAKCLTATLPKTHRSRLANRQLQVFIKIHAIRLSPRKVSSVTTDSKDESDEATTEENFASDEYNPDKNWFAAGMFNERIVASAILYCGSENVTDDAFAFRQLAATPELDSYEHWEETNRELAKVFGLEMGLCSMQHLGWAKARNGRALCWPNTLQHQDQAFKLIDPSKPGFRRLLSFYLVDPTASVISTSAVPPQQDLIEEKNCTSASMILPVADGVSNLLSRDAAFKIRHKFASVRQEANEAMATKVFAKRLVPKDASDDMRWRAASRGGIDSRMPEFDPPPERRF